MKSVTKFNIASVLLISSVFAHAVDPIGFERWTPLPSSYVEIGERCEYLQSKYNHPAPLIGPYKKYGI